MSIFVVKRKEKKVGIRYYLRKDQGKTVFEVVNDREIPHYPLYIEFTHRRKQNKCKSLFLKFHSYIPSMEPYIYYENYGISTEIFNEDLVKHINSKEPSFRTYKYDFEDLLICEKQHVQSLFSLFEDISDDDFTLSRLAEGYPCSLKKRAIDLYTEGLKELLLEEFRKAVPSYPIELVQIAMPSYDYFTFFNIINRIFDLTKVDNRTSKLYDLGLLLCEIQRNMETYMITIAHRYLDLTIPIWVAEGHSNKIRDYFNNNVFYGKEDKDDFYAAVSLLFENVEIKLKEEVEQIKSCFVNKSSDD